MNTHCPGKTFIAITLQYRCKFLGDLREKQVTMKNTSYCVRMQNTPNIRDTYTECRYLYLLCAYLATEGRKILKVENKLNMPCKVIMPVRQFAFDFKPFKGSTYRIKTIILLYFCIMHLAMPVTLVTLRRFSLCCFDD